MTATPAHADRYLAARNETDVRGAEAHGATIGAVQAQFPGFVFRLAGPAGAEAPVAGSDVAPLDADGRISTVLGFLDRVPAPA